MSIHSFHAKQDHHRSHTTWQMLIEAAGSEQDVVHVARDFVASFTPHEVELMPAELRPRKIVDGDDIARYGYELSTHAREEDDPGSAVIRVFACFFANAAERLARVSRTGDEDAERESA